MQNVNLTGIRLNGSAAYVADSPVGLAVRYRGSQASATVTVASGEITFKHGAAAAEAADSTVGVAGVVADGTYTTLGAMVDAINLSANWIAEIVDGLRADTSTNVLLARSETTLSPTRRQVLPLFIDTSVALSLTYRISARRTNFNKSQNGKRSVFQRFQGLVNVGSGTLILTVLDVDKKSATTDLRGKWDGTDNTELDTGLGGPEIMSEFGNDLLVRYTMSVDLPDTGAYARIKGFVEA